MKNATPSSIRRFVFLVDSRSDLPAIDAKAQTAGVAENLVVLDFSERSDDDRRAMFELLLKAAYAA